ncbi:transmembrane protein 230-like [Myotis myotis]|uniref:transmembrane protein 230-like n=1 Tax=Myotis myotis TaxID=51298 RepID=UPI00174BEA75|nr:transmembrane protein 230-like [Myotis myotis]
MKYSRLSSTQDGYIDLQFKKSPPEIPCKITALAAELFLIDTFLIITGAILHCYISKKSAGQTRPSPTDHRHPGVPARILLAAYRLPCRQRLQGYSYNDITGFDD